MAMRAACCTTPGALCFWAAAFAVIYGGTLVLRGVIPALAPFDQTALLASLGLACVANYAYNRTYHCGLTAPLFLIAAAVAAGVEARWWSVDASLFWGVLLMGVGLAFVLEWRATRAADATDAPR